MMKEKTEEKDLIKLMARVMATSFRVSVCIVILSTIASVFAPGAISFWTFKLACSIECTTLPIFMFLVSPVLAIACYLSLLLIAWARLETVKDARGKWLKWYLYVALLLTPILAVRMAWYFWKV
jgi:hypothetical protein